MVKKLGPLERGVVFDSEQKGLIRLAMRDGLVNEKFQLLFKKYEVQEGNWMHLAICLAMKYETGLKPIKKPGAKPVPVHWTQELDQQLLDGFNSYESLGLSLSEISRRLLKTETFRTFSENSLRNRYFRLMEKSLGR